ncbi:hypothetical protein [Polaromonas sp. CG9_12]|nr:hypothetical protein [Polaromonas sp. CG9_12]
MITTAVATLFDDTVVTKTPSASLVELGIFNVTSFAGTTAKVTLAPLTGVLFLSTTRNRKVADSDRPLPPAPARTIDLSAGFTSKKFNAFANA